MGFKERSGLVLLVITSCVLLGVKGASVIARHQDVCGKHKNVNEFHTRLDESKNENYDDRCIPKFGLLGDVRDTLKGNVSQKANSTVYEIKPHQFGFGNGAIGDSLGGLGEAIFLNGMAAIRSTDNASNYFETVVGDKFRSTFGIVMLNDCPGDIEMTFDSYPSKNLTLENMHKILLDDFDGSPFCYFGVADFTYFEGTAILKAAIYGEDITNTTGYFPESPYQLENQLAFIGGCVANMSFVRNEKLSEKLNKLLYTKEVGSGLHVHTHAVTLKRCVKEANEITKNDLDGVFHINEKSKIMSYNLKVFKIDKNRKLTEL